MNCWTHERIAEANEYAYKKNLIPLSVSSPNYGLAEQVTDPWGGGCVSISGSVNENARKWYAKQDMPVVAYSNTVEAMDIMIPELKNRRFGFITVSELFQRKGIPVKVKPGTIYSVVQ